MYFFPGDWRYRFLQLLQCIEGKPASIFIKKMENTGLIIPVRISRCCETFCTFPKKKTYLLSKSIDMIGDNQACATRLKQKLAAFLKPG